MHVKVPHRRIKTNATRDHWRFGTIDRLVPEDLRIPKADMQVR